MLQSQEEGPRIVCKKCKRTVSVNELKKIGEQWICFSCYENVNFFEQAREKMMKQKGIQEVKQEIKTEQIIEKAKSKNEVRKYQCMDCSYKFTSGVFNEESMCPLCGEKGSVRWIQD